MKITANVIFIILSFLFATICCEKQKNETNDLPGEMTFQINRLLLGEKYSDEYLGFSFSPPLGCKQMPLDTLQEVKAQIQKILLSSDSFNLEPKQFFVNAEEGFFCLLTALPSLALTDSSIVFFQQRIEKSAKNSEVQHSTYKYNHFLIYQSLLINSSTINFKLLIPQAEYKSFQIDYIIPKSIYANKIEVIESSIGSLSKGAG